MKKLHDDVTVTEQQLNVNLNNVKTRPKRSMTNFTAMPTYRWPDGSIPYKIDGIFSEFYGHSRQEKHALLINQ